MTFWIASLGGLAAAYVLGSIPAAYLAGKLLRGIDIREHGSRSVGATNALRVLGKWPALAVLLVDVLKGAAAIVFVRRLLALPTVASDPQAWTPWIVALAGLAALLGHSRPVWLKFSGGKSVATGLGVVLAISWPSALIALAVFGVVTAAFRVVSVGSIAAASAAIVLAVALDLPLPHRLLIVAGSVYVVLRHRANIQRLLSGTEPRIGRSLGR